MYLQRTITCLTWRVFNILIDLLYNYQLDINFVQHPVQVHRLVFNVLQLSIDSMFAFFLMLVVKCLHLISTMATSLSQVPLNFEFWSLFLSKPTLAVHLCWLSFQLLPSLWSHTWNILFLLLSNNDNHRNVQKYLPSGSKRWTNTAHIMYMETEAAINLTNS